MPFDIASLRAFAPAEYQCEKCRGLLRESLFHLDGSGNGVCPVCRVKYLPTKEFPAYRWMDYFVRDGSTCLNAKDALAQAHQLAEIAEAIRFYQQNPQHAGRMITGVTPLHSLLKALSIARKATQDRDVVEVVTEIEQVIELNNRLFAPVWAELSGIGEMLPMTLTPFYS